MSLIAWVTSTMPTWWLSRFRLAQVLVVKIRTKRATIHNRKWVFKAE